MAELFDIDLDAFASDPESDLEDFFGPVTTAEEEEEKEEEKEGASSRSTAEAAEKGFPRFNDLPTELRQQIYELAFPRRLLRFRERWLPGCKALVPEPLGPPPVARTCHEAWAFAQTRYHRGVPCRTAKLWSLGSDSDPRPYVAPALKHTWFHPGVDALNVSVANYTAMRGSLRICNPDRDPPPDPLADDRDAGFSDAVAALRPVAALAETVVVRPAPNHSHISERNCFPFADAALFPRLRTVLVAVHYAEWDNSGWGLPPGEPRPMESVRLVDPYPGPLAAATFNLNRHIAAQVAAEFGRECRDNHPHHPRYHPKYKCNTIHSYSKVSAGQRARELVREIRLAAQQNPSRWTTFAVGGPDGDGDDDGTGAGGRPISGRHQKLITRADAANIWRWAARYLGKEYTVQPNGDRVYRDSRDWWLQERAWRDDDELHPEVIETMRQSAGRLPRFEPVVMIHKAPPLP